MKIRNDFAQLEVAKNRKQRLICCDQRSGKMTNIIGDSKETVETVSKNLLNRK